MDRVVLWCAFAGAWLLVAGPLYQAALELRDESFENERIRSVRRDLPPQPPVSPWWWLVPPVKYVLTRRRGEAQRRAWFDQLSAEEGETLITFMNTATAWLYVSLGGFLLAVHETWLVVTEQGWPHWAFWPLAAGLLAAVVVNVASRIARSEDIVRRRRAESDPQD